MIWLLVACAGGGGDTEKPVAAGALDVRAEIPEPAEGFYDLVGPEVEVAPYSEVMYCSYLENTLDHDLIVPYVDTMQGEYGHHMTLLSSDNPKPNGTVEDCSSAEAMRDMHVYVIGDLDLPEGAAVRIPAGKAFVVQSHYVNTSETALLTRDVARFTVWEESQVVEWAAPLATGSLNFELPPGEASTISFDCALPDDVRISLLGGHMHEWGTSFRLEIGTDPAALETFLLTDPWRPEFRDDAPVQLYLENPLELSAGSILRTTCAWYNDTDAPLIFPEEMCASFGYLVGTDQPMDCRVEQ